MNTPLEAVTVTLIEVYVPAGTDRFEPTKVESVCRRVTSYDAGVIGTATNVPEDGVSEIPATGSVKLSMETPVGGRSKRVTLKFALPLPQPVEHPPFFTPLHDPKSRTITEKAKKNSAFIFTALPKTEFGFQARAELGQASTRCHKFYEGYWRFRPTEPTVKNNGYCVGRIAPRQRSTWLQSQNHGDMNKP